MQCNLDAKGKAVRILWGAIMIAGSAGVVALIGLDTIGGMWAWISAGALLAMGLLGIYEGRKGWCVVRAMGFKTPV
jgi:hypothetical protein